MGVGQRHKAKGEGQNTEDRGQMTEDGEQKTAEGDTIAFHYLFGSDGFTSHFSM